jgi:hypothetical protein
LARDAEPLITVPLTFTCVSHADLKATRPTGGDLTRTLRFHQMPSL